MIAKTQREHEEDVAAGGGNYTCLFRQDADGGYHVTCPELPPMIAYGETLDEARANAADEIAVWHECEFVPFPEYDRSLWYDRRI